MFWFCFVTGFFLTAFGQSAWVPGVGLLAAAGGYALFWISMLRLQQRGCRFFCAFFWYVLVQAVQLSWMTSMHYMGWLILVVYACLLLGLGLQFALFSSFLSPNKPLTQIQCVGLAGFWVILEWIRIYFLTGFTWNPSGLALADGRFSIQFASVMGIYGLSFWVMWTNLIGLNALLCCAQSPCTSELADRSISPLHRMWKNAGVWLFLVLFPHIFGFAHQTWVEQRHKTSRQLQVALVDTCLKVEEKYYDKKNSLSFIPPLEQWERVWSMLGTQPLDLIVLPEAAFPYGAFRPFCYLEEFEEKWKAHFGQDGGLDFPLLKPPLAFSYQKKGGTHWAVSNAFLAQSLANHYGAEVIIGLDVEDQEHRYNAAFQFHPNGFEPERYEKRILAPVGEYIPLKHVSWIASLLSKEFGIESSFDPGKEVKIFSAPMPIGVAICLEEIYSNLVRELRMKGAELFVSLSNDAWFPSSRLPQQHFHHARIRAIENGVFLFRSSNMGVTGGIDCFGQPFSLAAFPGGHLEALTMSVPVFSYPTLYSLWGDKAILFVSGLFVLLSLAMRFVVAVIPA